MSVRAEVSAPMNLTPTLTVVLPDEVDRNAQQIHRSSRAKSGLNVDLRAGRALAQADMVVLGLQREIAHEVPSHADGGAVLNGERRELGIEHGVQRGGALERLWR